MRMYVVMVFVLSMGALPACGGDESKPGGGSEGEGEGEGTPDGGEGEGEGPIACALDADCGGSLCQDGECVKRTPVPLGADGEPCGAGGACEEGLSCLTCAEANLNNCDGSGGSDGSICTCPQWFGGTWWAEYSDIDTHGYPYDMTAGNIDRQIWMAQEVELRQEGCVIFGPRAGIPFASGDGVSQGKLEPPHAFRYTRQWLTDEGAGLLTFTGELINNRHTITGTCDGDYPDFSKSPTVFFHITCAFTLTQR